MSASERPATPDVTAIRALWKAAPAGPWHVIAKNHRAQTGELRTNRERVEMVLGRVILGWNVAEVIAAAPEHITALCDALDARDAEIARLRDLLRQGDRLMVQHHRAGALYGWLSGPCPVCCEHNEGRWFGDVATALAEAHP